MIENAGTATQATTEHRFVSEIELNGGVYASIWQDGAEGLLCLSNFPSAAQAETLTPDGSATYGTITTWECWLRATDEDIDKLRGLINQTLAIAAN